MSDNQPMGYVLPSGIKQLKNDHPATIYAPDNAMVPGSHPVWLYDQPSAPAAVPEDLANKIRAAARAMHPVAKDTLIEEAVDILDALGGSDS